VSTSAEQGTGEVFVYPDAAMEAVLASVGGTLLDPSVCEMTARAGREQGRRIATSGLI
jgi:hypothetical protein